MTVKIEQWGIGGMSYVERKDIPAALVADRGFWGGGQLERVEARAEQLAEILKLVLAQLSDKQLVNIARALGHKVLIDGEDD